MLENTYLVKEEIYQIEFLVAQIEPEFLYVLMFHKNRSLC